MKKAVAALHLILQGKTVHSTKTLQSHLRALSNLAQRFTNPEAQQDFANKSSNFEKYCTHTGRTSWGRNEFWEWWNNPVEVHYAEAEAPPWETPSPLLNKGTIIPKLEEIPDLTSRTRTVEYALEFWCGDLLLYVPCASAPPIYPEQTSVTLNEREYAVRHTFVTVAELKNGMIKLTHEVNLRTLV